MHRSQEDTQAYFIEQFAGQSMDFMAFMEAVRGEDDHVVFSYDRDGQVQDITWSQWERDVYACAAWMFREGMTGQHIGIALPNCYEWFVVVFAAGISGNVAVSLNPGLAAGDLENQIRMADVSLLLFRGEDGLSPDDFGELSCPMMEMQQLCREYRCIPEDDIRRDFSPNAESVSLILFSSGTSGTPKGVMLSQKNLLSPLRRAYGVYTPGGYLCLLPLSHISGIWSSLVYLAMGARVCICESAKYFIRDFRRFEPGVLAVVPMQLDFFAAQCRRNAGLYELFRRCVKEVYCLGASLNHEYAELFAQTGISLLNGYGMTETSGMITAMKPSKPGSLGRVSDMYEYRIKDGELQLRTAKTMLGRETWGSTLMLGYYKNDAEANDLYDEGWLCTGDLVREDEEGFLFLTGRKKNVIILSNGENVNPELLENRMYAWDMAEEIIVLEHGQKIVAKIYLGKSDSPEMRTVFLEKTEAMNRELPMMHRVAQVFFSEEPLPRNANGKIARARCTV